jgi:hypothetical protein
VVAPPLTTSGSGHLLVDASEPMRGHRLVRMRRMENAPTVILDEVSPSGGTLRHNGLGLRTNDDPLDSEARLADLV